ncbi:enoyl-CoA-hydratase DpgB [Streptomyces sp. MSC1_001]|jgi:isomerase DpgB|uniref:enoyl-CoA-hydratase DpgB n=1 Tax=Streptomyces sp. MSC1_001 TaxID=2909263 RepID=UPI00202E163C|nr:enoyl-CoA-hydratase DpgB [Streptomyces sp. MSC1_001]
MNVTPLPDGLGLKVDVDGTRPLHELTSGLNAACDEAESHQGERLVMVLRLGSTTAHQRAWPGDVRIQDVNRWERAVRRLERLTSMNIAVASGACGGPSLDLLLASDFRIGARNLLLMLPVNDGHFWPGMGIHRLVQHLGVARARQIVMWGDDITADKAHNLALIDQISEDVAGSVHTATVLMGRISDQELAVRRQLLLEAGSSDYDDALGPHLAACDRELRRLREQTPTSVPVGEERAWPVR